MTNLNGVRILVTRPAHQANALSQLITEQGGIAVRFPTLAIVASESRLEIQKKLTDLSQFQWLVFISANAVNFALKANDGKISANPMPSIVAIGAATAHALQSVGLTVDVMPEQSCDSEGLLALPQMQVLYGQSFLIVRGNSGREDLANTLRSRGAVVEYLEVYNRTISPVDNQPVLDLLATKTLDVITATSVDVLQNLLIMIGAGARQQLLAIPLVVVSERIRCIAVNMGFERVVVTESPSDAAILEAVTTYVTGG